MGDIVHVLEVWTDYPKRGLHTVMKGIGGFIYYNTFESKCHGPYKTFSKAIAELLKRTGTKLYLEEREAKNVTHT